MPRSGSCGFTPTGDAQLDGMLGRIQNDIFDVEADLCILDGSKGKGPGGAKLNVTEKQVQWIEQQIDVLNETLPPLRSFILPGGTPAAAYLHLARTMCRRAERLMVELRDQPGEEVTPEAIQYVNRLSDFLFVAGRHANDRRRKGRAVAARAEPLIRFSLRSLGLAGDRLRHSVTTDSIRFCRSDMPLTPMPSHS